LTETRGGIHQGDALDWLPTLEAESVNCIVTSPPFWGLRAYDGEQERVWGSVDGCAHEWGDAGGGLLHENRNFHRGTQEEVSGTGPLVRVKEDARIGSAFCLRCGVWRGALGLEPTPDLYVAHLSAIFHEARRVLRPDGVLLLNMGDSYAGYHGNTSDRPVTKASTGLDRDWYDSELENARPKYQAGDLKPKDLCGMPWRLAFALQSDGWYLRQEITLCKVAPMPESVRDRCTSATEKLFMFTKEPRYWTDMDAVREAHCDLAGPVTRFGNTGSRGGYQGGFVDKTGKDGGARPSFAIAKGGRVYHPLGRNLRNWWTLSPDPMGWELCEACERVYSPREFGQLGRVDECLTCHRLYSPKEKKYLPKREGEAVCESCGGSDWRPVVYCRCGADKWISHFATFPLALPERCIQMACPEKICAECGEPWVRRVRTTGGSIGYGDWCNKSERLEKGTSSHPPARAKSGDGTYTRCDLGLFPACSCDGETRPGVVLDPFMGSGTTALAAENLGRSWLGCEMSRLYIVLADARLAAARQHLQLPLGEHQ